MIFDTHISLYQNKAKDSVHLLMFHTFIKPLRNQNYTSVDIGYCPIVDTSNVLQMNS